MVDIVKVVLILMPFRISFNLYKLSNSQKNVIKFLKKLFENHFNTLKEKEDDDLRLELSFII